MKTKLILIDGIPGSGKTTAAQYAADWLGKKGVKTALYLEGNLDHPADYESVACLDPQALEQIAARFPAQWEAVQKYATQRSGETFIKFLKMYKALGAETIPEELFQALASHEIYNSLSLADFSRVAQACWLEFACAAQSESQVVILECCFLQNPITNFLGHHNSDPAVLRAHLAQTAAAIEPLYPALVYLDPGDIQAALQHAVDTRPAEWYEYLTWYITGQGYGKANHLQGLSGIARFYERMREIQIEFLQTWNGPKLYLENAAQDWTGAYQRMAAFYEGLHKN